MSVRLRRCLAAAALCSLGLGCGAGTGAIVASGGSSGSSSNAAPTISAFQVLDAKVSPAQLRFVLQDNEADPVEVSFFYQVSSGQPILLTQLPTLPGNPTTLATTSGGMTHTVEWTFIDELGIPDDGSFLPGVTVFATIAGGIQSVEPGVNQDLVGLGNDEPVISNVQEPDGEVSGIVLVSFEVADTSDVDVDIRVEFDLVGDDPDAGWQLARPAQNDTTPQFALMGVETSEAGEEVAFFWDTEVDVGEVQISALLRFTATDGTDEGEAVMSREILVDNNSEPIVSLNGKSFVLNPDARRGIPVPYRLVDDEGDDVQLVFQWRYAQQEFPDLPADPAGITAALEDPELRRELQIASEFPRTVGGQAFPVDRTSLRLPELARGASHLLADGLIGCEIELLRTGSTLVSKQWAENPLNRPVAVLPLANGVDVLVLDSPSEHKWRLREIELATGNLVREVALASSGDPRVACWEKVGVSLLVASDVDGSWTVERVNLTSGETTTLIAHDGSTEAGEVRGMVSIGPSTALITVGSSLVFLEFQDPVESLAATLRDDLNTPWGLVLDPCNPRRVFLAERDSPGGDAACRQDGACGRILGLNLDRLEFEVVVQRVGGRSGTWIPRPTAIAVEANGTQLLVLADEDPDDDLAELFLLRPGAQGGNEVSEVKSGLPAGPGSIASGPGHQRVSVSTNDDSVFVEGGIVQRREILAYQTAGQIVRVDPPFDPPVSGSTPWRIRRSPCRTYGSPPGVERSFNWNSGDVAEGKAVLLRAVPVDSELGVPDETAFVKTVLAGWGRPGIELDQPTGLQAMDVGDLDEDGDLDIVVALLGVNKLRIYTQSAPGVFDQGPSFGAFSDALPRSVKIADMDGDGDNDLVVADIFSKSPAWIVLQESPGVFSKERILLADAAESGPGWDVEPADLDGDGDLDIVVVQVGGFNNLRIYSQTSPGEFSATLDLGGARITPSPVEVAVVDVDADGDLDIISANTGNNSVTIFLQTVPGTFDLEPIVLRDASDFLQSVTVADVDGDGDMDVVADLTLFMQVRPGAFTAIRIADGNVTRDSNLADLDGDGDLDLLQSFVRGAGLGNRIFFQTAPGSFDPEAWLVGDASLMVASAAVADLDGDGLFDIVSAGGPGIDSGLTVFYQAGVGVFDQALEDIGGIPADMDGDGDLDLVSTTGIRYQHSPGSFDIESGDVGGSPADMDGDGDMDLVTSGAIHFQGPRGTFVETPLNVDGNPLDIDGDGDLDLVSTDTSKSRVYVHEQVDPLSYRSFSLEVEPTLLSAPAFVTAADLDEDGDQDLIVGDLNSGLIAFFQTSTLEFEASLLSSIARMRWATAADLDGDGDLDIASACGLLDALTVFFQTRPGVFESDPLVLGSAKSTFKPIRVATADVDVDGNLDLISSSSSGVTVFHQTSPGAFDRAPLVLLGYGDITPTDLDGDGDVDLVTSDRVIWSGH